MRKLIPQTSGYASRDPYVIWHNNRYYRCFTEDADSVSVSCADTIDALSTAESKKVYIPEEGKPYSKELWAPELHVIDDKCYIYVACDDGDNNHHRMYVLENHSNNPMDSYVMHGKISDQSDKWAIDGTVLQYKGDYYFVWSGWEGDSNICQNLYIAKMKSPYELEPERVMISTPEYVWEKRGSTGEIDSPFINEGPFAFVAHDTLYLTYSAAGSWCEDYCIAMLKLVGENPLDPDCWEKFSMPIFSANDLVKGAGHCSVVCENDTTHVFFHAWDKNETNITWNTVSLWHANMKWVDDRPLIV